MSQFIHLLAMFGPGTYLFLRWQFKQIEPSREAFIASIALAYFLLLQHHVDWLEISHDHEVICKQLGERLWKEDPEEMEFGDGMPIECERHTAEYRQAAADAQMDSQ